MSLLIEHLRRFSYNRDRHNSLATRKDRRDMLVLAGQQLINLGFADLEIAGLDHVHVEALVGLWQSQALSPGTLRNRLAVLRWWAQHIGKPHLLALNKAYGIPRRHGVPQVRRESSPRPHFPSDLPTKICRRCFKGKPLALFNKNRHADDGYTTECLECHRARAALYDLTHRAQKQAYDATHKAERAQRKVSRRVRWSQEVIEDLLLHGKSEQHIKRVEYSQYKMHPCGVYIMQLLARDYTCKIGCSTDTLERMRYLWKEHGPLRCLVVVPYPDLFKGEKIIHSLFAPMRIYDGAGARELFVFDTRAKQKHLERFCATFATYCVEPLLWEVPPPRVSKEALRQPELFS